MGWPAGATGSMPFLDAWPCHTWLHGGQAASFADALASAWRAILDFLFTTRADAVEFSIRHSPFAIRYSLSRSAGGADGAAQPWAFVDEKRRPVAAVRV